MKNYLKMRIADWVLVTLMSMGLMSSVCSGFDMNSPGADSIFSIFMTAGLMSILLLVLAYRRLTTVCGIAAGVVVAVGSVFYIQTIHPLADEGAHSLFIFILIGIISTLLTFLLSRSRVGTVFLFIGGNLVGAGAHFLQFQENAWSFLVFLLSVLVMFFYRVYMVSMMQADMGRTGTAQYMRQTVALCLAAVLIASGIFAEVVRPLDPPTQDLKLIRVLKQMDMLEVLGIYNIKTVLNPFLNSSETPDQTEFSQNQGEDESDAIENQSQQPEQQDTDTNPNIQEKVDAIKYVFAESHLKWLLIPLILLAIASAIMAVLYRKKKWRTEVQNLSYEDAVLNYYGFFLRDMKRAGLKKPEQHTLREFTESSDHELEVFDAGGIGFAELSEIYEKVFYGHEKVNEDEYQMYEKYFGEFHKNLKKRMGTVRYYIKWITL